ncbi:MAG: triphosphoribosyl-dephospho-CoA synthase [Pirellulaceae bacterium]
MHNLTPDDTTLVYDAIRLAGPGGISPADQPVANMDVDDSPPNNLLDAMQLASEWDWIASEYVTGFEIVFAKVAAWLLQAEGPWPERIVTAHVRLMSEYPDSLIRRKCGQQVAEESAVRAARTLAAGPPGSREYNNALADLDFWLRCDGNRRNPGTTADLIAAGIFVGLLQGIVTPPF